MCGAATPVPFVRSRLSRPILALGSKSCESSQRATTMRGPPVATAPVCHAPPALEARSNAPIAAHDLAPRVGVGLGCGQSWA